MGKQGGNNSERPVESQPELTRMEQTVATVSDRPMYPPPGLDEPNTVPEHPNVNTMLIPRRPILGRRRTPSQTSTSVPLPLEDGSTRSFDLDTVSERTDETGPLDPKRPRRSEHPAVSSSEEGRLLPLESSDVSPSVSDVMLNAAIESASRNRMLGPREDDVQENPA